MRSRKRQRRRTTRKRKKRTQRGRGIWGSAVKWGIKLGKDKRYNRMGALGATGSYKRLPRPWER